MKKLPTNLLSAEEITHIERRGLNFGVHRDLLCVGADEKVIFTLKGHALFQHAIDYHGYSGKLANVQTLAEFKKFQRAIQLLVLETLSRKLQELQERSVNPNEDRAIVEAVLYGSPYEIFGTLSKSLQLEEAGPNISLFPLKNYGQLARS